MIFVATAGDGDGIKSSAVRCGSQVATFVGASPRGVSAPSIWTAEF
jgi:hypothetical protein